MLWPEAERGLSYRARPVVPRGGVITPSEGYCIERGLVYHARAVTSSEGCCTEQGLGHRARVVTSSEGCGIEQGSWYRARGSAEGECMTTDGWTGGVQILLPGRAEAAMEQRG